MKSTIGLGFWGFIFLLIVYDPDHLFQKATILSYSLYSISFYCFHSYLGASFQKNTQREKKWPKKSMLKIDLLFQEQNAA